jgi:hypothetical protein
VRVALAATARRGAVALPPLLLLAARSSAALVRPSADFW